MLKKRGSLASSRRKKERHDARLWRISVPDTTQGSSAHPGENTRGRSLRGQQPNRTRTRVMIPAKEYFKSVEMRVGVRRQDGHMNCTVFQKKNKSGPSEARRWVNRPNLGRVAPPSLAALNALVPLVPWNRAASDLREGRKSVTRSNPGLRRRVSPSSPDRRLVTVPRASNPFLPLQGRPLNTRERHSSRSNFRDVCIGKQFLCAWATGTNAVLSRLFISRYLRSHF